MSEFELSTLAVLALLLFAVGAYSYWQIHRAQKAQEAHKARLAEQVVEPPSQHRYPAYAPEQEPLPETWPSAPASVQSESTPANAVANQLAEAELETESEDTLPSEWTAAADVNTAVAQVHERVDEGADEGVHEPSGTDVEAVNDAPNERLNDVSEEVIADHVDSVDVHFEAERVQAALEKMTADDTVVHPDSGEPLAPVDAVVTAEEELASAETPQVPATVAHDASGMSTPVERMSVMIAEPETAKNTPLTFDVNEAEEKQRIAQRITAQEIKRRATWEVFAPFARFEHWLHTAHPQGVDPIRAIDAEIVIAVNQPKTAEDIERALYDLRLDTPLPLRLMGVRAGQISMESGAKREWQDLQAGAPYCAIKLTLQLANRSHYAQEELIQRWFGLAEALRKRLAGQIDTLPDVYELSEYAQFLHALARRVGQPIILQLHKDNGLWPAYEVHQQLTACGATLIERGIYVARNERNTPVYAVMNDVNNPRAQDFFRNQLAVMYVHTLSFCVELARTELRLDDADAELEPIQRLLGDMKTVADALGAQWQNQVGEEISVDELAKIAHEQTRIFARQLSALGLPVGALMTKRLLLG